MSDSAAESVREEIDDVLDKLEAKVAAIKNALVRGAAEMAVATLRKIFAIPDDIGGDED